MISEFNHFFHSQFQALDSLGQGKNRGRARKKRGKTKARNWEIASKNYFDNSKRLNVSFSSML